MNYAAYVQAKLDDPNTPRSEYMRYWQEMQDLQREQKVYDRTIAELQCRAALQSSLAGHAGRIGQAVGIRAA